MTTVATGIDAIEVETRPDRPSHKYSLLLMALAALIVVSPFLDRRDESWLLGLLSGCILVTALYIIRGNRRHFLLAAALATAGIASNVLSLTTGIPSIAIIEGGLGLAFYSLATFVIFIDVIKARRVSADTLCGAVCVYLLLGASFGLVYYALELIQPGSFNLSGHLSVNDGLWAALHYYSYVTLTTVGYGDISPASSAARSVAIVEGIAGQLYLAVLVARMIGRLGTNGDQS